MNPQEAESEGAPMKITRPIDLLLTEKVALRRLRGIAKDLERRLRQDHAEMRENLKAIHRPGTIRTDYGTAVLALHCPWSNNYDQNGPLHVGVDLPGGRVSGVAYGPHLPAGDYGVVVLLVPVSKPPTVPVPQVFKTIRSRG